MLDEDEADIKRELDAFGNDCLQIEDLEDETSTCNFKGNERKSKSEKQVKSCFH